MPPLSTQEQKEKRKNVSKYMNVEQSVICLMAMCLLKRGWAFIPIYEQRNSPSTTKSMVDLPKKRKGHKGGENLKERVVEQRCTFLETLCLGKKRCQFMRNHRANSSQTHRARKFVFVVQRSKGPQSKGNQRRKGVPNKGKTNISGRRRTHMSTKHISWWRWCQSKECVD